MAGKVTLNWSEGQIIDKEYFPEDKLGRVKYATFLTKLLAAQGFDESREDEQKRNYVLNLNSVWGSGKTYFLKRWSEDLKEYYPVVYVDAWKKDYSDDPLMTVISSIIEQLRDQAGKSKDDPVFKVPRKLIGLLKAAAPGIARGLVKRYVGIDPVAIMNADDNAEDIGLIQGEDGNPIDMSIAASAVVKHLIEEHDAKSEAIESLKISVSEWVEAVVGLKGKELPAFIFIDELDRCRPSYAVEMLETIKHIFDIKGVVFVVATDTEQLQHAVKAIYGEGFDAKIYLGRFFNSRYSLKAPNLESFLEVHCDINKFSGEYLTEINVQIMPFNSDAKVTLNNISIVLDSFGLSARSAIQITDRIVATLSNMPPRSKVDILMLATLLCIKEKDSALFDEIVAGGFSRSVFDGDNNKTIYLDEFFESYLTERSQQLKLTMYFDPQEYSALLKKYTHQPPVNNPYRANCYEFLFIDYLKEIFSPHFGSGKKTRVIALFSRKTQTRGNIQTPLEKISAEIIDVYEDSSSSEDFYLNGISSMLWFKYIHINDEYDLISNDEYSDFVELASPLDWMGEEELLDKSEQ